MMISLKESLGKIFEKLGGKISEIQGEIIADIEDGFKNDKKIADENIYESIGKLLNDETIINEDKVYEFLGFGKKKQKENVENNDTNEYDKSKNSFGKKNICIW